jgi:acetyl-CoA synthetase
MEISAGIDWSAASHEALTEAHRWQIPERFNIAAAIQRHADGSGRTALVELFEDGSSRTTSFDELEVLSGRLARAMSELGIEPGDRVGVFLPQCRENALAHLAAFRLGAISVPLSPLFRAEALRHRLAKSGAKLCFTGPELSPHLAEVRASLPALATIVDSDAAFAELIESASEPLPVRDTSRDDPAMLIYTSGTTGLPRGALHAHRFLPGRLTGFELCHRLESGPHRDRPFWTPADWAWVGGLVDCVLTPWVLGCPVLAAKRRGFDAQILASVIARGDVRSLFLPPTALHRLLGADPSAFRSILSVHTAGEPLPAETYRWAAQGFQNVYELYGLTEIGAVAGSSPFVPVRPGSLGKPYPGHRVVLLDDDGDLVEGAGEGELAVHRSDPGMFLGYFEDPEATASRFRGDYLVTGDVARRDEDGYLYYVGRNDDVFNTAGYRVGPTDIEATLTHHPLVSDAGVIGEPDAERGHVVKAFVLLKEGTAPSPALAAELQNFVKERLAAYEYPKKIVFVRELPRTVSGKLQRSLLRARDADARFGL